MALQDFLFQRLDFTLSANEERTIAAPRCEYFACELSSAAVFRVAFDDAAPQDFSAGAQVRTPKDEFFDRFRLINPTAGAITITVIFGRGDYTSPNISGTITANIAGQPISVALQSTTQVNGIRVNQFPFLTTGLTDVACASGAATQLVGFISKITIRNPEPIGGAAIRVGASDVNATRGIPVFPGEVFSGIYSSLYCWHNAGYTINVPVQAASQ